MSAIPDPVRIAWMIAEIICEQGRVTTALSSGQHKAIADYYGVRAVFSGSDLVRLSGPDLDLLVKRFTKRTDSFFTPSFNESGYAYRFDKGDIIALNALLRDMNIMQSSFLCLNGVSRQAFA